MNIPNYILISAFRHFSTIIKEAKHESGNIKLCEAIRLGKKDLKKIEK